MSRSTTPIAPGFAFWAGQAVQPDIGWFRTDRPASPFPKNTTINGALSMFFDNATADLIARGFLLSAFGLVFIVILIRIVGLRSLSKMTTFDFIMTIALGSLLAAGGQATEWSSFAQIAVAIVTLFSVQVTAALVRRSSDTAETMLQNQPVILMRDGVIDEQALEQTRVARSDLIAKLREANVLEMSKVRAVVLESTGDVSVLHGDVLEDALLDGVAKP